MKTRDVIKLVEQDGWVYVETHGSHRQYKHPVKKGRVTIAGHPSKEMPPGTLKSVLKTGWIEMKYAVIFEKSTNGYGAYVPDLPGCVAVGDTLEQTQTLIREAIELHLKGMREDGEPIPAPSTLADHVTVSA